MSLPTTNNTAVASCAAMVESVTGITGGVSMMIQSKSGLTLDKRIRKRADPRSSTGCVARPPAVSTHRFGTADGVHGFAHF